MARVMVGLPGAIGHNNNVAMYCVVLCCAVLCYAVRVQYGRDDRLGSERRLCLLGKRLGCGYTCTVVGEPGWGTVGYNAVQRSTPQYITPQHTIIQYITVQHRAIQHSTVQRSTIHSVLFVLYAKGALPWGDVLDQTIEGQRGRLSLPKQQQR